VNRPRQVSAWQLDDNGELVQLHGNQARTARLAGSRPPERHENTDTEEGDRS